MHLPTWYHFQDVYKRQPCVNLSYFISISYFLMQNELSNEFWFRIMKFVWIWGERYERILGAVSYTHLKRVLDKLSLITQPYIRVLRNGELKELHMDDLVLDDITYLHTGSQVCADAIIREGKLEVDVYKRQASYCSWFYCCVIPHIHKSRFSWPSHDG